MNWKRILVPHDFSASANHALASARDEAKAHGAAIVILHVVDLPSHFKPDTVIVPDSTGGPINIQAYAISQAESGLADLAARLAKEGAAATTFVRVGNAVEEITRFVDEQGIDLVIMGTHGRSGLAHLLIGSVTERVVRTCKVPVLTIRHAG
jgi:nucleotide-binding universal stress UspA family protein